MAHQPTTTETMEIASESHPTHLPDEALHGPSAVLSEQLHHQESQWQTVVSLHRKRRLQKQQTPGKQDPVGQTAASKTQASATDAKPSSPATCEERGARTPISEDATARSRPRRRAPPLPRTDMKIIIRPAPGLILRKLQTHQVARAIVQATGGAPTCKGDDFITRLRPGSNIIIVSTPHEGTAATLMKIMSLTFHGRSHPVKVYLSTPEDLLKGVVHGIDVGTSEEELMANLRVRTHGVRIVRARMLGQSQTALLHFEGPQVPRFVYFYGGEMPCRDYQPTRQFCPICRTTGHQPDVCPNPTVRACNTCNHPNPEAGHTCVPKCALCGGAHLTAAKDCNNKLKRIRPRGKPASTTAPKTQRHPRPRWFSSEREDSDSDYSELSMTCRSRSGSSPRSRSRSCSRPRPHFRSPRRRSQSTSKQQQQGTPIIAAPKDKGSQQNQRKTKAASPKRTNTKEQEVSTSQMRIYFTAHPTPEGSYRLRLQHIRVDNLEDARLFLTGASPGIKTFVEALGVVGMPHLQLFWSRFLRVDGIMLMSDDL
ncbi:hypothetical protein HPB49_008365 [Dermacentor silvarum]|uniref:Uncharacterized protein n=1 Tax=Dermacentor silvarum TaxID=543639 RepID=A0ACB8CDY8_DERSI|nr:hypothetical protein HPB49_008365 [Dermacentor silvarum]